MPPATSLQKVCSFQLPKVCSFRLPLTARTARRLNDGRPSRNAGRSAARSADGSLRKPDVSRSVPRDRNYGSVFMKEHFTSPPKVHLTVTLVV